MRTNMYQLALGMTTMMVLGACQQGAKQADMDSGFKMAASHRSVLAGETVTFTTSTANTLGRNAEIQWHTSGGDVLTSNDNRVAQISFADPGTYTVSADLLLDNVRVDTQIATVEVRPLSTVPGQQRGLQPQDQRQQDLRQQDQQPPRPAN